VQANTAARQIGSRGGGALWKQTYYFYVAVYSHVPHNDVSVNDRLHTRRWSHKIIIPGCL